MVAQSLLTVFALLGSQIFGVFVVDVSSQPLVQQHPTRRRIPRSAAEPPRVTRDAQHVRQLPQEMLSYRRPNSS